jgi:hypothetical protein
MHDGEHDHALGFDTVEDSIWETRNEGAAHFRMGARKHLRIALDRIEDGIDGGKEVLAKAL